MSSTASNYYTRVQNTTVVKMMISSTHEVVSLSEVLSEFALPTDGACPEDVKELVTMAEDQTKGPLVRIRHLREKVTRRGARKLMSYKPVKLTVDTVCNDYKVIEYKVIELRCFQVCEYLLKKVIRLVVENQPPQTL